MHVLQLQGRLTELPPEEYNTTCLTTACFQTVPMKSFSDNSIPRVPERFNTLAMLLPAQIGGQ